MKRPRRIPPLAVAACVLLSCAGMTKEQMGTTLGALGGATLGALLVDDDYWFLGAAAGGALGGLIGNQIGNQIGKFAPLRGGPGTDYRVVGKVQGDEPVRVVGKVQDSDWFMISEGGAGSGFVYSPLLKRLHSSQPRQLAADPEPRAPADQVETVDVAYQTKCRKVLQKVRDKQGKSHEQRMRACRGSDGWAAL